MKRGRRKSPYPSMAGASEFIRVDEMQAGMGRRTWDYT